MHIHMLQDKIETDMYTLECMTGLASCSHVAMLQFLHSLADISTYGVATISRLLKIIGLFCRISSLL